MAALAGITAHSAKTFFSSVFLETGSALVASRSSCTLLTFILRDRGEIEVERSVGPNWILASEKLPQITALPFGRS